MKIRHVFTLALVAVLAAYGGGSSIVAGEGDSIEIIVGSTRLDAGGDLDDVDDSGNAYAFAFDHPFSTGRFSGNVNLARVDAFDNPELATWAVDVRGRLNLGDNTTADGDAAGRARAYLGFGLGGVWTDELTSSQSITVDDEEYGEITTTVETQAAEQFLRFSAVLGSRFFFNADRTVGVGGEVEYGRPINGGVDIDSSASGKIFLILPAGPQNP